MAKLLANRWFRWTLLTFALCGLGVGIYRFTPPEPMWERNGTNERLFPSRKSLVVFKNDGREQYVDENHATIVHSGPIRLLDWLSGNEIAQFMKVDGLQILGHQFSSSERYLAVGRVSCADKSVWLDSLILIDLIHGKSIQIPQKVSYKSGVLKFSPDEKYLAISIGGDAQLLRIYETTTGILISELPCSRVEELATDKVIYVTPNETLEVYYVINRKKIMTLPAGSRHISGKASEGNKGSFLAEFLETGAAA